MKRFSILLVIRKIQIDEKDGRSQVLVRMWCINYHQFGNYLASLLELEISIHYDKVTIFWRANGSSNQKGHQDRLNSGLFQAN